MFYRFPVRVSETDVNAVQAGVVGGPGGWVSGTPANLADGATVQVLFDLGADWAQYPIMQINVQSTVATSLSALTVSFRDTAVASFNPARAANHALATNASIMFLTITTASSSAAFFARPMGRYMVIQCTNTAGAGAQGAGSKITVAQYPC